MATIEYKPHCANCGALIDEEVTYSKIIVEAAAARDSKCTVPFLPYYIKINPCRCKKCDEIFDSIVIRRPTEI